MPKIDVLIVPGQYTFVNGRCGTEYPADQDVYWGHMLEVGPTATRLFYTHVVCSGGLTQRTTQGKSEAESFVDAWRYSGCWPFGDEQTTLKKTLLEKSALESAENVYLAALRCRLELGDWPIGRIGVFAAWKFKKARFTLLAKELGISERFFFHGYAGAEQAAAGQRAEEGERELLAAMVKTNDHLLLAEPWEKKRRQRFQGDDYDDRLSDLKAVPKFKCFFDLLDECRRNGRSDGLRKDLQQAFLEAIGPFAG